MATVLSFPTARTDDEARAMRDMPEGYSLVHAKGWYFACPDDTRREPFGPYRTAYAALDAVLNHLLETEG